MKPGPWWERPGLSPEPLRRSHVSLLVDVQERPVREVDPDRVAAVGDLVLEVEPQDPFTGQERCPVPARDARVEQSASVGGVAPLPDHRAHVLRQPDLRQVAVAIRPLGRDVHDRLVVAREVGQANREALALRLQAIDGDARPDRNGGVIGDGLRPERVGACRRTPCSARRSRSPRCRSS